MTELAAPGTLWLASDIHLSPHAPQTRQAFLQFLERAAAQSDALFLAGDIFDVWTGDDLAVHCPPEWLAPIVSRMRECALGTQLYLLRGNRDFLIGETLARALGAQLLPERVRLLTDQGPVLLSHGDEYCTADVAYQRFRRFVRYRWVQRAFLALGRRQRQAIAGWARRRSQAAGRLKAARIMDVQEDAVVAALRAAGCGIAVHGHTHRPARHSLTIGCKTGTRLVLPDWDLEEGRPLRGGWLEISARGLIQHPLPQPSSAPSA